MEIETVPAALGLGSATLLASVLPGSRPLRNPAHERYARARSLLRPKIEAYRYAYRYDDDSALDDKKRHALRGNASKLERGRNMQDRIAWLCRQEEEVLAEKRRRLEEFLWLVHDANPADLWEIAEKPRTDDDGEPIEDENGQPIMVKYQRLKFMAELPEDLQRTVQSIKYTESGRPQVERYSALQANQELRKLLGIGGISDDNRVNEFERMSDDQLIAALRDQANELGVNVTLTYGIEGGGA